MIDDPPYPPSQTNYQLDSKIKDMRWFFMIKKKVFNNPINTFRGGNGSVPQGVKELSKLGPRSHILVRNRSNTIPWA